MTRSVAIVGSGPGGMYVAQGLIDKLPGCRVDVIERLPSPFGLIRGGVAPDHQKTKRVSRAFEKTLEADGVRYLGNVEIGRDVSVAELEGIYDAVVLAYGAPWDNKLGCPGEDLPGVFGSNEFVGWYNCHPDFLDLNPNLDVSAAVIVGVGNVALDVARVLAKTREEMAATDVAPYTMDAVEASSMTDVHMFGRRSPVEAAFTNVELREMGELQNAASIVDLDQFPAIVDAPWLNDRDLRLREKNVETMKSFADVPQEGKDRKVHFTFFSQPVEVLGDGKVEAIRMERTQVEQGKCIPLGEYFEVPCGLVITCIGSRAHPIEGVPFNDSWGIVEHEDGKVRDGLYAAGWVKRGATGTIGTNKTDALDVVDRVIGELSGDDAPGPDAMDALLADRGTRVVSLDDWRVINRLEEEAGGDVAPRKKFHTPAEMIAALDGAQAAE